MDKGIEIATKLAAVLEKGSGIADTFLKAGIAYTGYKAFNHWAGGVFGLLGYKLAMSDGIVSNLSGVGMLAALGLTQIIDDKAPKSNIDDMRAQAKEWQTGQVSPISGTVGILGPYAEEIRQALIDRETAPTPTEPYQGPPITGPFGGGRSFR